MTAETFEDLVVYLNILHDIWWKANETVNFYGV